MSLMDPIADYLTRIRNACLARHHKVDVPASRMVRQITQILLEEGYIRNFAEIEDGKQGIIRIYLKYDSEKRPAIEGLERISKPGLRRYVGVHELPRVMNGYGIAILSTPKGIMTEKKARKASVGGEVICTIW